MELTIQGRKIGPDHPPFVIAEIGINHEGSFEKAIALADAAIDAGAECVKFQSHITEKEMIPTDMKPGEISSEPLWNIIKRCELTESEEIRVKEHVERRGAIYLCTPFSREAADRLEKMGVDAYKIGSGEANNLPLIKHIAKKGKPMLVSTGMNDIESMRPTVEAIRAAGCDLALFHCTSMYPTPFDKVRLGAIEDLRRAFHAPVGFSDHSPGFYAPLGAVALGACIIEKHFTISRSWPGPDTPLSIEPDELAHLVKGSRAVWESRGGAKTILPEEKPVIDFAYASVVTIAPVRKGDTFNDANTWVKRPGTGRIHARELDRVLGKRAARDLPAESSISPGDVEGW